MECNIKEGSDHIWYATVKHRGHTKEFSNESLNDLSNDVMEYYTDYIAGSLTDTSDTCGDGYNTSE